MVKINILGGKNEIGGNKILTEHEGTRIFLDFGMSFNRDSYFFSEYLNPRKCATLGDFFEFGLLPMIEGNYRSDYLEHMQLPLEERSIDAVFLTHVHAEGLVFVEHPIRDIDRVNSILEASKANDRIFAIPLKLVQLIEALGNCCPFTLDDVEILVPLKIWGLIAKEDISPELITQDYKWENDIINKYNYITFKDLIKTPGKYVVSMSMWEVGQLVDIRPEKAIWIKSSCEPFSDEMLLDDKRKKHWLEHFEIKEFSAHASGHASGNEIHDMIKEIGAETVISVHTEHPDMLNIGGK